MKSKIISKIKRPLNILLALILASCIMLVGLNVSVEKLQNEPPKIVLSVGNPVDAFTGTVDYVGTNSSAVQQALNALPATGGEVQLVSPAYTFTGTVSRAINNVKIKGNNGTTVTYAGACFSVGVQTGWAFEDIRIAVGGSITNSAAATLFNVTVGADYVAYQLASAATGADFITDITGDVVGSISGGTVEGTSVTDLSLTDGRVVYAGAGGDLSDEAAFAYNSGTNTLIVTAIDAPTGRGATIKIASSTASATSINQADIKSDYANDENDFATAVAALTSSETESITIAPYAVFDDMDDPVSGGGTYTWAAVVGDETLTQDVATKYQGAASLKVQGSTTNYPGAKVTGLTLDLSGYDFIEMYCEVGNGTTLRGGNIRLTLFDSSANYIYMDKDAGWLDRATDWYKLEYPLDYFYYSSAAFDYTAIAEIRIQYYHTNDNVPFWIDYVCLNSYTNLSHSLIHNASFSIAGEASTQYELNAYEGKIKPLLPSTLTSGGSYSATYNYGGGTVELSEGEFYVEKTTIFDGGYVAFKGQGDNTIVKVKNQAITNLTANYVIDDNVLTVADTSLFDVGEQIEVATAYPDLTADYGTITSIDAGNHKIYVNGLADNTSTKHAHTSGDMVFSVWNTFTADDVDKLVIEDMTIDGNPSNWPVPSSIGCGRCNEVLLSGGNMDLTNLRIYYKHRPADLDGSGGVVDNCYVDPLGHPAAAGSFNLRTDGAWTVQNCTIMDALRTEGGSNCIIKNNYIDKDITYNSAYAATNTVISGNRLNGFISLANAATYFTITGNTFTTRNSIQDSATSSYNTYSNNVNCSVGSLGSHNTIIGNSTYSADSYQWNGSGFTGIYVNGTTTTVQGNVIEGGFYGISVGAGATYSNITNNIVHGCAVNIKLVTGATPAGTLISGNIYTIMPGEIRTYAHPVSTLTQDAFNSLDNPFGQAVTVKEVILSITTGATATTPDIQIGIGASATTDYNNLINDAPGETIGQYWSISNGLGGDVSGVQVAPLVWATGAGNRYLNCSIKDAAATGMVAKILITVVGQ